MFVKGISGNPGGRPKSTKPFTDEIIRLCIEGGLHKALVSTLAKKALAGDTKAAAFLIERVEGKAKQTISLNTEQMTLDELLEDLANGNADIKTPDMPDAD